MRRIFGRAQSDARGDALWGPWPATRGRLQPRVARGWGIVCAIAGFALAAGAGCDDGATGQERAKSKLVCDRAGVSSCSRDGACADAALACSDGCCLLRCVASADCAHASDCGPLGCGCDEGVCQPVVCSARVDCPSGQLCQAGTCVLAPPITAAARCELAPLRGVVRQGAEPMPLWVNLYDTLDQPLPMADGATSGGIAFATSAPSRGTIVGGEVVGGAEAGPFTVTARVGGASCESHFLNFAEGASDELRVVVIDELTGVSVEGAIVQIEKDGGALQGRTGSDGAISFAAADLPAAPRTVSVFHREFTYLTLIGSDEPDLLLPLRRVIAEDRAGGFVGSFDSDVFDPALLNAGLVGMSIPGSLVDLSFSVLLGPVGRFRVDLGGSRDLDIPQGIVLGLGNTWFKPEYQALGLAGSCADLAKTRAGRCGTWSAWGLAGGMPLEELPLDELTSAGKSLDVGQLLSHLLPHVRRFKSSVVRDVGFDVLDTRLEGGLQVPDRAHFSRLDLHPKMRLGLRAQVVVPKLPVASGDVLDGVIVLGGALAPDRGLVPLGITAGIDGGIAAGGPPSGRVVEPSGAEGTLRLRLAPLHGGLEGSRYAILAMAVNFTSLMEEGSSCTAADRSGCTSLSALVQLQADLPADAEITFRGEGFVGLADQAVFDSTHRSFTQNGAVAGSPNLMRLSLGSRANGWVLYFPADVQSFSIPRPLGADDRADGVRASLQALRLGAGWSEIQGFGPGGLGHLAGVTTAFSTADLPPAAAD